MEDCLMRRVWRGSLLALMVAWFVISFYAGYIGQIDHMLDGM